MLDPAGLVDPNEMSPEQIEAENRERRAFNAKMGNVDPVRLLPEGVNTESARQAAGEVARATGKRYRSLELACARLPRTAQQDLIRLIRDLKSTAQTEKNKRRRGQFF